MESHGEATVATKSHSADLRPDCALTTFPFGPVNKSYYAVDEFWGESKCNNFVAS
jgi:hypothetical protein